MLPEGRVVAEVKVGAAAETELRWEWETDGRAEATLALRIGREIGETVAATGLGFVEEGADEVLLLVERNGLVVGDAVLGEVVGELNRLLIGEAVEEFD